jgi:aryl-alcohol dehydrogenase-like predicted oxidoreductase
MEYRTLGNSGVTVSAFSLGSWLTYEFMEEQQALAVIGAGLEAGINFLDDARYDDRTGKAPLKSGYSEVLFGNLLRKGGWNRAELVIANKLWLEFYPQQSLQQELESSLDRLQLDYLDLAYCAPPPASLPLLELLGELDQLIKTGKLRYWGVLNWPVEQIKKAYQLASSQGLSRPCAAQLPYSLLQRSPVEDQPILQLCASTGLSIVASYALHGGLLTGKYQEGSSNLKNRFSAEQIEKLRQQGLLAKVERVRELARELGCTPAQLSLAYCLKYPHLANILFGATSVSQLEENLAALEILPRLDDKILTQVKAKVNIREK